MVIPGRRFDENPDDTITVDLVRPDGDGYRLLATRDVPNPGRVGDMPIEEIRGPALQRWIDVEMPHSD